MSITQMLRDKPQRKLAALLPCVPWLMAPGVPVIDVSNLAQNVLAAVRAAQTVTQQARQLTNEARMIEHQIRALEDMARNSLGQSSIAWGDVQVAMSALSRAIEVGTSLPYHMLDLADEFQARFPGYTPPEDWNAAYREWSRTAQDTLLGSLQAARVSTSDAPTVQIALDRLAAASDSAEGRLQAIQVTNQLASLQIAEMAKLRQLVGVQINAQSTYAAAEESRRAGADAALSRLIDAGVAPPPVQRPDEGFGQVPRP